MGSKRSVWLCRHLRVGPEERPSFADCHDGLAFLADSAEEPHEIVQGVEHDSFPPPLLHLLDERLLVEPRVAGLVQHLFIVVRHDPVPLTPHPAIPKHGGCHFGLAANVMSAADICAVMIATRSSGPIIRSISG